MELNIDSSELKILIMIITINFIFLIYYKNY